MRNYISARQLSEKLAGRSVRSIQRDVKSGALPQPYRVSGTLMFDESEVDQHITETNTSKSEQESDMKTEINAALAQAREIFATVSNSFTAARNELNAMKAELANAPAHNSELIEARADALADGTATPEGDLIDVKTLQQDIAVHEGLVAKLQERLNDGREAVKDAGSVVARHRQVEARKLLIQRFGFDGERNKFPFNRIAGLDGSELLDLFTTARIAWGNGFTLSELFKTKVGPISEALRTDSKKRVDELLA